MTYFLAISIFGWLFIVDAETSRDNCLAVADALPAVTCYVGE